MTVTRRRELLTSGIAAAGVLAFGPSFWRAALAAPAALGEGPYGPLQAPGPLGFALPKGFSVREVARAGETVAGGGYAWHPNSDGMATYAAPDGGWIVVSNSESSPPVGGVGALRFDADGAVVDGYPICEGTAANCGGGPTPWGTWLTCEEFDGGHVYECWPLGDRPAVVRPAMGAFQHEAAAVDPVERRVYMTEDKSDGGLYRFTPAAYPDLSAGLLEIAVADGSRLAWAEVPDPSGAAANPTRHQVPGTARFRGGEGIWYDSGVVYFSTKGDDSLWAYDTRTAEIERLYDPATSGMAGFLTGPDNLTVHHSGDLFVCEDNGDSEFDVVMVTPDRTVAPFLRVSGPLHDDSELAGVCFSPDGTRMYVASQRAYAAQSGGATRGAVYEISGPFRPAPGGGGAVVPVAPPAAPDPVPPPPPPPAPAPVPVEAGAPSATTIHDVDAPGLRVRAARRMRLATLARRGVLVTIHADEPARLAVALRTSALRRERGRRGSVDRPVMETLVESERAVAAGGTVRVRLRLPAAQARRLRRHRGRRVRLRLAVQARDAAGNVTIANRVLVIAR
ncbi:MAG TPA: alkaline phosphatase PhoX [Capillimicrobium sp.]|nr:alkaline phosphatase PhoX [Capillimicrobium sp.]